MEHAPKLINIPDPSGQLPLQLALRKGRTWSSGIQALVLANPSRLTTADIETRLCPFQLAAVPLCIKDKSVEDSPPGKKRKYKEVDAENGKESDIDQILSEFCGMSNKRDDSQWLETIFHLLRECPNLLDRQS